MVRFTPRSRPARYAALAVGSGLGLLMLPPKELLPPSLLSVRVLLEGTGRITRCGLVGAAIFLDYQLSLYSKEALESQAAWNTVHERCARRLVRLAEQNGGLYVKAGQIFSNMNHVLPPAYCSIMASLQDAVMQRPFEEILAVLNADLGPDAVREAFEYIDPKPVAAASLAQVHRARRRETPRADCVSSSWSGCAYSHTKNNVEDRSPPSDYKPLYTKDVAIKVQYIDIARRFRGDMIAIDWMLSVAGWAYPGYDLSEIVRKLQATVAAELDFRQEAANCERAARQLRQAGFGDEVVCPTIHHDLQSPRVLIMNYVKGVKINDKAGIEALGINPKQVLGRFIDAIAFQMFGAGFFHADPHAGNVLVQPIPRRPKQKVLPTDSMLRGVPQNPKIGNEEEDVGEEKFDGHSSSKHQRGRQRGQVVLLDYGLCGSLTPEQRKEFSEIWVASVTHDDSMLKRIASRYGTEDYALFASCFLQFPYALHSGLSGSRLTSPDAREAMRRTMKEKMFEVNVIVAALPKDYALLLRTIMATKAINKDMGELVDRHRRFLNYALDATRSNISRWRHFVICAKARVFGLYSSVTMALLKALHPEIMNSIESSLQVSG